MSHADIHSEIDQQVFALEAQWNVYRQLYSDGDTVALLNDVAPGFFQLIAWGVVDNVILAVCRLSDPAKSMGRDNLTFAQLRDSLSPAPDAAFAKTLDPLFKKIMDGVADLRAHRNKRIAHLDLSRALSHVETLPGIERGAIEAVLASVRDYLNAIHKHYENKTVAYEHPFNQGDGKSLIQVLKHGVRWRKVYEAAHTPGKPAEEILALAREQV
jgi:hypothetical protein